MKAFLLMLAGLCLQRPGAGTERRKATFISGIPGLFFKQFAITIAGSTIISCFVSLALSPALCAVLLRTHALGEEHNGGVGLAPILHPIFSRFNAAFSWLSTSYGNLTSRFVRVPGVMSLGCGMR